MVQIKSRARHLPLERPALFFFMTLAVGLLVGDRYPGHTVTVLTAAAALAAVALMGLSRWFRSLLAAASVLAGLGYASLQPWTAPALPPAHISFAADGPAALLTGTVACLPERFGPRTRFILDVGTFNRKPACGRLRVTAAGNIPDIQAGDRLQFPARVRRIRNFNNPGTFDYRRYLAFQKVRASAWVRGRKIDVLEGHRGFAPKEALCRVRSGLSRWITGTVTTREGRILAALVTGDRSGITPALRSQFTRLGIGHLLAISGLHVGIVATVSFALLHWLCRRVNGLLAAGLARRTAALLTLLPVLGYGLIAGMSPSTQRAVIMAAVYLLTLILERQQDVVNTLAAAALVILVIDPPALFSVSFQLSFAAVFSIVYGLSCLPERWRRPLDRPGGGGYLTRVAGALISFFWVSFFAIIGTVPLSMHYFNQVSYVGLPANFFYIPVVGFITVPLALAAAVVLPVSSLLAQWLLKTAAVPLAAAMGLADRLGGLAWISTHTVTITWFEVVCLFSGIVLALRLVKLVGEGSEDRPGWLGLSGKKWVWASLVAVFLCLGGDAVYWLHQRVWHRDLKVTCLDVRQGSAALLEFPGGKTMLIDGGGYADNSVFDMGARVVAPFLWRRKILTVDTLVLSHPNSDHLNGLLYIAENFNVGEIWTNSETARTAGYRSLMQIVRKRRIAPVRYAKLPRHSKRGGVTVAVLYPPVDFLSRKRVQAWRTTNNNSLVVRAEYEGVSFLFAGDIMRPAEEELIRLADHSLKSTVLFVPHHGSNSSSSAGFLRAVRPALAIISAGQGNRYGFPQPKVLDRYRAAGCQVCRTDRQGAITLTTRGGRLQVETFLEQVHP